MDKQLKKCPLGIQTFEKVISEDLLYVDKTQYIYSLAQDYRYVFLSRPRRFGKSLLASTLHSYFSGKKELFKGLAIEKLETEWAEHPVLHFDMSLGKHMGKEQLERFLGERLAFEERKYGIDNPATDINDRFTNLIVAAYEKTGRQAVVLIDEYDAPLLDVVHEDELLPQLRQVMRNFYSPLKACDPYLRFVFLTGITKFSQMSIFSELNNLKNVSMMPEYAGICGITEEELTEQLADYVEALAESQGKTHEEALQQLKQNYDGYHFCWPSPDIFNPFSLLNALSDKRVGSYWFASGTPTYLIEMMRKFGVAPSQIGRNRAMASAFDAPTERMTSLTPLLYQSGYTTIKDYNPISGLYTLDIPNSEIRIGLMESLLPNYVQSAANEGLTAIADMYMALLEGDLDGMLRQLQQFLLTVPYCENTNDFVKPNEQSSSSLEYSTMARNCTFKNYEGHYQQMLYVIFSLLGRYVDVEVRTATGRVDMVMQAFGKLYLFELKLNRSAAAAMQQINLNDYPARFSQSGLPIVKVGINFDTATRTLSDWVIE